MPNRSLYPRVTTVLHEGFAESGLETWAVKVAFKRYKELLDAGASHDDAYSEAKGESGRIMRDAARRGTATHHMIEGRAAEELTGLVEGDMPMVQVMYNSFLEWAKDRNFEPLANEVAVWSDKHGYKGTLDCIGNVDGVLTLLDWKTSNSLRLGYRLQLAAYWYAYKESQENPLDTKLIRIVRFGGRSDKNTQVKDLVEYDELIVDGEEEISIDFNTFLAAKRVHDWKLKRK